MITSENTPLTHLTMKSPRWLHLIALMTHPKRTQPGQFHFALQFLPELCLCVISAVIYCKLFSLFTISLVRDTRHLDVLEAAGGSADALSGPLPPDLLLLLYLPDGADERPVHVLDRLVPDPSLLFHLLVSLPELHHLRTRLTLHVRKAQLDLLDVMQ